MGVIVPNLEKVLTVEVLKDLHYMTLYAPNAAQPARFHLCLMAEKKFFAVDVLAK